VGEFAQAFRFLLKAQELTPDDGEVRLKLGGIYLLTGKRDEAREEAVSVLTKEPNNVDALALLADTSTTPEQVDATIKRIEGALATVGDRAKRLGAGLVGRSVRRTRFRSDPRSEVARAHFRLRSTLVKRDSAH